MEQDGGEEEGGIAFMESTVHFLPKDIVMYFAALSWSIEGLHLPRNYRSFFKSFIG